MRNQEYRERLETWKSIIGRGEWAAISENDRSYIEHQLDNLYENIDLVPRSISEELESSLAGIAEVFSETGGIRRVV